MYALARLGLWAFAALVCAVAPAMAQYVQQGTKLVGSGAVNTPIAATQGASVGISADGTTLIEGAPNDNGGLGAAWIFTQSGGVWAQQGLKLVGSGSVGPCQYGSPYSSICPEQGYSVALSADGTTAIVGGLTDDDGLGAAWVFVQSGGVWTQQGPKLVGAGYTTTQMNRGIYQGWSVALSADGNTAIVGGPIDNNNTGAAWVFTRSGGTWTQQGNKLTASEGASEFGSSVTLSADGNTAIVTGGQPGPGFVFTRSNGIWTEQSELAGGIGGTAAGNQVSLSSDGNTALGGWYGDNSGYGAAWVFTQNSGVWSQQAKLVGNGGIGNPHQGESVALSPDGGTAILGGASDNGGIGAVWIFAQNGGVWTQQGPKLVGNGSSGNSEQGGSVAVSSGGTVAIVGAPCDASCTGAVWVFAPGVNPPNVHDTHDFNDDGVSDILWRNSVTGDVAVWLESGLPNTGQVLSSAIISQVPSQWSVAGTRDFNGDGHADILWLDGSGDLAIWLMNGTGVASYSSLGNVGSDWQVAGTGDFNGDGTGDILWRNTSTGELAVWLMSHGQYASGVDFGVISTDWQVVGTGDFNGDGTSDILWHNTQTGDYAIWLMSNGQMSSGADLGVVGGAWSVVGTGDFNGDGTSDILWRDTSGNLAIWLMSNGQISSSATLAQVPTTWSVVETGDFDGNGKSDILWMCTAGGGSCSVGDLGVWLMNGLSLSSQIGLGNVGTTWQVQGQNAD